MCNGCRFLNWNINLSYEDIIRSDMAYCHRWRLFDWNSSHIISLANHPCHKNIEIETKNRKNERTYLVLLRLLLRNRYVFFTRRAEPDQNKGRQSVATVPKSSTNPQSIKMAHAKLKPCWIFSIFYSFWQNCKQRLFLTHSLPLFAICVPK